MRLTDVLTQLKDIGQPVLRTADVMAYLNLDKAHASKMLTRLADSGHVVRIKQGLWVFPEKLQPMTLAEYLTAPLPSYISLQSALYYHGMISQISAITYSISLARTRIYKTPLGIYSIHHVHNSFFFGYEPFGDHGVKLATPEKALLDFLYLGPAKSKLFSSIPEFELTREFSIKTAEQMINRIDFTGRRTLVEKRFKDLIMKSGK
ncbi:unnamed protein product [marine sediment metagenome]|uniref:AbiEi antitoxin N-terminal domain-containing protein n=1 Tax=marine sediment metagenome TaxID=412755 RepID=X0VKG1_9ZZZZ